MGAVTLNIASISRVCQEQGAVLTTRSPGFSFSPPWHSLLSSSLILLEWSRSRALLSALFPAEWLSSYCKYSRLTLDIRLWIPCCPLQTQRKETDCGVEATERCITQMKRHTRTRFIFFFLSSFFFKVKSSGHCAQKLQPRRPFCRNFSLLI